MSDRPGLRTDLAQVPHGRTAHRLTWPLPAGVPAGRGRAAAGLAGRGRRLHGRRVHARVRVRAHRRGRQPGVREGGQQAGPGRLSRGRTSTRHASSGRCPPGCRRRRCAGCTTTRTGSRSASRRSTAGRRCDRGDADRARRARWTWPRRSRRPPTRCRPGCGSGPWWRRCRHWSAPGTGSLPTGRTCREARALATAYASLPDRAFCHTDLRDDNVLLLDDGSALRLRLELAGAGSRLAGHRRPAGLGVRRRARRGADPGRAGADPRRRPRARRHVAGRAVRLHGGELVAPAAPQLAAPPHAQHLVRRGALGLALRSTRLGVAHDLGAEAAR